MNDMTAYMGLDTRDYERGLKRAEQLAQSSGGRVATAFMKQQEKSFQQLLGGNWGRALITGMTAGFGILGKAQADYAEKNKWAAESTKGLSRELGNLWEEVGARTSLAVANLSHLVGLANTGGMALTQMYRGVSGALMPGSRDIGTERFLFDMKVMEAQIARTRAENVLSEQVELRYLKQVAPEKAARLEAEIALRKRLAEITEQEREKIISRDAAEQARERERGIFANEFGITEQERRRRQTPDIEYAISRYQNEQATARANAEREKERYKKRREMYEENYQAVQALRFGRLQDAIDIARTNKQEKRAVWLEYELSLQQRIAEINDSLLTDEQRREALAGARLAATARLVGELRGIGRDKLLSGQSIESGLYSQALSQQVLARNVQAADPSLKIAMDMLKLQQQSTGSLKSMDDTTKRLLEVTKRGTVATYAR